MQHALVRDWMTTTVITVSPETTLPEAHRLMTGRRIRRLPVVEDDRLVGIVTRGDIRGAEASDAASLSIWELNYLLSRLKVGAIMTPDPITIAPDAAIGQAAGVMLQHKISSLPVLDADGRLVGIITESDIFRLVVRAWGDD